MRAATFENFGELDNIEIRDMEKPEPGEGEVLVKVQAAGVNPVDAAVARGMLEDAIPTEFPVILGWDMAGEVEENGFSARRFNPGDKVYAYARRPTIHKGTFAEYVAIPESYLALAPEKLSIEEAGGIPLVGLTAYQSVISTGQLKAGQTIAILGASGGVGTIAIQLAKSIGATVIGVASKKNHDYMKQVGAHETIDYNDGDVGDMITESVPGGVDLIFHCSRGDSLDQCMEAGIVSDDGRVVSITKSTPDDHWDVDYQYVFVEPNSSQLNHLTVMANDGDIRIPEIKTHGLDDTQQALKDVETLHNRGKLIITP